MTSLFWSRFSKGFPLSTCNYRHKHLLWRKTIKKLKLICLLKSVDPGNNWQNEGMPKCLSPSVSCWSHNIKISQSIWGKIEVFLRWLLLNIHCSSFPVLIYFYLCNFFWGGGVGWVLWHATLTPILRDLQWVSVSSRGNVSYWWKDVKS